MRVILYLTAFIIANLIVLQFGSIGLIFTSLFLIPFDFVMRCVFHETWKGKELIIKLGLVVIAASILTYIINSSAKNIALGSALGFISAQIVAGLFYQYFLKQKFWIKVNGSDAIAIIIDSIVFQLIAFSSIDYLIFFSQFSMKLIGGIFWYWVIFEKFKMRK